MKTTQSSGTRPVDQTVAVKFEVKTGGKSIAIEFAGQRLRPHAGSATFWSWLRLGNASCGGNVTAFFLDLWDHLPSPLRLRGVRADAGFCLPELLALWEQLKLPYVVVAQLSQPIQKLIKGDLPWIRTEVPGTEVTELATPAPAGADLSSGAGRRQKPRGQAVAGRARLSLSSLGDQSAAGVLSHPRGKTTIKLAVPRQERVWGRRLWEKILSPFPNCNAVENRPAFTS
jgi:hypothetical protein